MPHMVVWGEGEDERVEFLTDLPTGAAFDRLWNEPMAVIDLQDGWPLGRSKYFYRLQFDEPVTHVARMACEWTVLSGLREKYAEQIAAFLAGVETAKK